MTCSSSFKRENDEPWLPQKGGEPCAGAGIPKARDCRCAQISRIASRGEPKERPDQLKEEVLRLCREHPWVWLSADSLSPSRGQFEGSEACLEAAGPQAEPPRQKRLSVPRAPPVELCTPNQAWYMDLFHERLENGRTYGVVAVLDGFTRECLLLRAGVHHLNSADQRDLDWLFPINGMPGRIESDTGPEFRSLKHPEGVESGFIQPRSPWQKNRVESFFDKLRDELLKRKVFFTCEEAAQTALDEHTDHYRYRRPHRSLNGRTPSSFKALMTE